MGMVPRRNIVFNLSIFLYNQTLYLRKSTIQNTDIFVTNHMLPFCCCQLQTKNINRHTWACQSNHQCTFFASCHFPNFFGPIKFGSRFVDFCKPPKNIFHLVDRLLEAHFTTSQLRIFELLLEIQWNGLATVWFYIGFLWNHNFQ
jgi:hypothetical protein